ncbi:MAG: hypothetical protein U0936_28380 [Planctomycetaceae bacterium]
MNAPAIALLAKIVNGADNGNLLVGVWKDSLIARIGKDAYETALQDEYVTELDVTSGSMKGWVMVDADGIDSDHQLSY